jgi:hypothetical protein
MKCGLMNQSHIFTLVKASNNIYINDIFCKMFCDSIFRIRSTSFYLQNIEHLITPGLTLFAFTKLQSLLNEFRCYDMAVPFIYVLNYISQCMGMFKNEFCIKFIGHFGPLSVVCRQSEDERVDYNKWRHINENCRFV